MSSMAETCERSFQKGHGTYQLRTASGRLLRSGEAIESVEPHLRTGRGRVMWFRCFEFGRLIWRFKCHHH